jgi:hypothetical protein
MELIKIELTNEEALMFRKFQEHYEDFALLYEAGVFNVKNGHAVLNFDSNGTLITIEFKILGYKKGLPVIRSLV